MLIFLCGLRSSSGSLATLAAIRRASSLVSRLVAELEIPQRLPVGVADDEAFVVLLDRPRRGGTSFRLAFDALQRQRHA
jgi:hypothetical protein